MSPRVALARLRERGYKIGLVKIRAFRPFPTEELRKLLGHAAKIAVVERNLSLGREGIFCSELKAALCNDLERGQIQGYLAGIGGTNVDPELIERIVMDAWNRDEALSGPIWMTEEE